MNPFELGTLLCNRRGRERQRDVMRRFVTKGLRNRAKYNMNETAHVSLEEALSKGPPPPGNLAVPIFAHGSLEVELYTPKGDDPQKPHRRDEVYLVAKGTAKFFDGQRRHDVMPGSFLFVAAGQPHRFEQFSNNFAAWVFFYGPDGGEATSACELPGTPLGSVIS
jgi:mannose-6-phosphate isomerase-like protein (cupin superfamily)